MGTSNTSLGRAEKGSKFWMQMFPNTLLKFDFDQLVGEHVMWLSPLKKENYKEYQLNDDKICRALNIKSKSVFSFWPYRQPQWDSIAIGKESRTLYLIEAKANKKELLSKCNASPKSKEVIKNAMYDVCKTKYNEKLFEVWTDVYYQLGNRLTFLSKMEEWGIQNRWKVKLVLLNFVNDYTYIPTTLDEWQEHYRGVFLQTIGKTKPPKDVMLLFYNVKGDNNF